MNMTVILPVTRIIITLHGAGCQKYPGRVKKSTRQMESAVLPLHWISNAGRLVSITGSAVSDGGVDFRHNGKANLLFADFHAAGKVIQELRYQRKLVTPWKAVW